MIFILTLAVTFGAGNIFAQLPKSDSPPVLARLCGKLEHAQDLPEKAEPNAFVTKERDLPHVTVSLYPAPENGRCCEGATPAATTVTGHWGSFKLETKQMPAGLYWLQVEPNGSKYRMLIRYAPQRSSDRICAQTVW